MATKKTAKKTPVTKKSAAKKAPAAKAPAKKTTTKKAPKVEANGDLGLRKPQARILKALAKSRRALTRKEIAEQAPVDQAGCVEWIGSTNPEVRQANDTKHFPSLVSLKLVSQERHDIDGKDTIVYELTQQGKTVVKTL